LWPYSSPPTSTTPWSGNSTSCSGPGRAEPPSQVVVRVSRCWCGRPRRAQRRIGPVTH
jgi:hypothetical protein